jgi:hypothetical protein
MRPTHKRVDYPGPGILPGEGRTFFISVGAKFTKRSANSSYNRIKTIVLEYLKLCISFNSKNAWRLSLLLTYNMIFETAFSTCPHGFLIKNSFLQKKSLTVRK